MKKSRSLVLQMLVLVLVLLVLPISIAGIYLYNDINSNLLDMEKERVQVSSQATVSLLDKYGTNLLEVNKSNSNWEDFRLATENEDIPWIEENINTISEVSATIDFISTTDLSGTVISQIGDVEGFTGKLSDNKILEKLKRDGDFSGITKTSNGLAMIAVTKITNDNGTADPVGYVVFGRILDNKVLLEIKETLSDDIALLASNGSLLTTSKKITEDDINLYKDHKKPVFDSVTTGSTDLALMVEPLQDYSGQDIGIMYISQKQPTSTAVKASLIHTNLIIASILLGLMILISFVVARQIISPIKHLVRFSETIAKGNLQTEIQPSIFNRKDEIGQLGNAMSTMKTNFQMLIKEVSHSIDQVAISSEELSVSSEETSKATHEITLAINEVASGAETQLTGAITSLHAMEQLTKDIQQIASTVSAVSEDSQRAESKAMEGNSSIEKAVEQMKVIDKSFSNSATVVQQLASRSKEIGTMAELIKDIANQTNLLALNAAIEAARAGEHGKGFSVVADEVRKLAEQTADSAQQVSSLVETIQVNSSSSLQSMKTVNEEVKEGLTQILNMGKVFEQILLTAQQVAEKTTDVAIVSKQMEQQTKLVASTVEKMADISKDSSRSSHNVASASQEQLASIEEISASYRALTDMAQELRNQINKFQV
ncbi:methyl-accepting chemotaxis protein [Robertmurraya korlensis]|uniref:methyl-accepting chemotaxis protein n=1 Tax=Robertmurraya korlensis TaxID=519977 RepID=UPI0008250D84|nr:methyl-accepting chemotaxis protein [Robertmurraya korlensis]